MKQAVSKDLLIEVPFFEGVQIEARASRARTRARRRPRTSDLVPRARGYLRIRRTHAKIAAFETTFGATYGQHGLGASPRDEVSAGRPRRRLRHLNILSCPGIGRHRDSTDARNRIRCARPSSSPDPIRTDRQVGQEGNGVLPRSLESNSRAPPSAAQAYDFAERERALPRGMRSAPTRPCCVTRGRVLPVPRPLPTFVGA